MATRRARDIEKGYPQADFVAKLRRLADAVENGKRFSLNHWPRLDANKLLFSGACNTGSGF